MKLQVVTRSKKIKPLLAFAIIATALFLAALSQNTSKFRFYYYYQDEFESNLTLETNHLANKWLLDTEGCKILDVDPFHQSVKKYIKRLKPHICPKNITDGLVYIADQTLFVNATVKNATIQHYNTTKDDQFRCCVDYLQRFSVEANDYVYRTAAQCIELEKSLTVSSPFMKIQCFIGQTLIYENFEVFFLRQSDIEAKCKAALENAQAMGQVCEDQLSVLIVGVDSMSRLNFHRQLPKTYDYLVNDLDGVEFLGYNKMGPSTATSLMPLFTGQPLKVVNGSGCGLKSKSGFDQCIFIMDTFGMNGYRTAYIEDEIGLCTFTYAKKGFTRKPADYYSGLYFGGIQSRELPSKCLQGKSEDELVVDWAVKFQQEFANDLHFGFFWMNHFSHDHLNKAQHVDPFLLAGLREMVDKQLLNRTLLIVLSDHGMRLGNIMKTPLGAYEVQLPFMAVVLPEWFKKKYARITENLTVNARHRLTTMFDLHWTLVSIARCSYHVKGSPLSDSDVGQSLFEPISPLRTCENSGIPHEHCSCYKQRRTMDSGSPTVKFMAAKLVEKLNNDTSHARNKCAELHLTSVSEAEVEASPSHRTTTEEEPNEKALYHISVATEPGNGTFKALYWFNSNTGIYESLGEIERISAYGNTSACIKELALKPICYCKE